MWINFMYSFWNFFVQHQICIICSNWFFYFFSSLQFFCSPLKLCISLASIHCGLLCPTPNARYLHELIFVFSMSSIQCAFLAFIHHSISLSITKYTSLASIYFCIFRPTFNVHDLYAHIFVSQSVTKFAALATIHFLLFLSNIKWALLAWSLHPPSVNMHRHVHH